MDNNQIMHFDVPFTCGVLSFDAGGKYQSLNGRHVLLSILSVKALYKCIKEECEAGNSYWDRDIKL